MRQPDSNKCNQFQIISIAFLSFPLLYWAVMSMLPANNININIHKHHNHHQQPKLITTTSKATTTTTTTYKSSRLPFYDKTSGSPLAAAKVVTSPLLSQRRTWADGSTWNHFHEGNPQFHEVTKMAESTCVYNVYINKYIYISILYSIKSWIE